MRYCARVGGAARGEGGGGGEKTDDEPRSDITANLQEVPTAGRHRPAARPAGSWGRVGAPSVPALLRKLRHVELGLEHIWRGAVRSA